MGTVKDDCVIGFSQDPELLLGPQVLVLVGVESRGIRSGSGWMVASGTGNGCGSGARWWRWRSVCRKCERVMAATMNFREEEGRINIAVTEM